MTCSYNFISNIFFAGYNVTIYYLLFTQTGFLEVCSRTKHKDTPPQKKCITTALIVLFPENLAKSLTA